MNTSRPTETAETSLTRDLLYAARYYLGGRRGLLIFAGLAIAVGLALNWNWLVAAGIAPILIGALPCLAMCALGLCMNKASGSACSSRPGVRETVTSNDDTVAASRVVTLDVPPESPVGQLPNGAAAPPPASLEPHLLKERSTNDA